MESGKLPEHIRERAVKKHLTYRQAEHIAVAGDGRQNSFFAVSQENGSCSAWFVTSQETIVGKDNLEILLARVLNNIWAAMARPVGVSLSVLLSQRMREIMLRRIMQDAASFLEKHQVDLTAVDVQITDEVTKPVIVANAVGVVGEVLSAEYDGKQLQGDEERKEPEQLQGEEKLKELKRLQENEDLKESEQLQDVKFRNDKMLQNMRLHPEKYAILCAGSCGASGTKMIAGGEKIAERFSESYREDAAEVYRELTIGHMTECVKAYVPYFQNASQMGIFGALWDLAESLKSGFRVELEKIPIRQETIEFCEVYDKNPYLIPSDGAVLVVTKMPEKVLEAFADEEIPAVVIGHLEKGNDKIITSIVDGEVEERFLDSPRGDELGDFRKK